ncbi:MAG TPA: tetratricopeptide repeat protein [Symbiobacteriaceae bacterium]|nr:tetratricopeptide repeat protein [Symbiobacteriaceae bacterium]
MLARKRISLAAALLISVMLLTACSGRQAEPTQEVKSAKTRPALVVPKTFASEDEKLNFAVKAVEDRYYAEAAPLLQEITASRPEAAVYTHLGTAKYNLNDTAGAIEAWSKAAEMKPELKAEMRNYVGNALRDAKRLDEAEAAYREALQLDPTGWQAATNLATMLRTNGKVEQAIAVLEEVARTNGHVKPLQDLLASLKSSVRAGS